MIDNNQKLPRVYLIRHGETEWSVSRRHTGMTDVDLTEKGVAETEALQIRLRLVSFRRVLTSPLLRARRTAELAGYASALEVEPALQEWNYGDYEGITTAEIHANNPEWNLFHHGAPNGESVEDVRRRVDQIVAMLKGETGNIAVFSHAHFLRALTARWILQDVVHGQHLILGTSAISILGFEHGSADEPVIEMWNQTPSVCAEH